MTGRKFFVLFAFMHCAIVAAAQNAEYLVNYNEKVYANYNIMSASKNEPYKEYSNNFFLHLYISFLDDFHIQLKFEDTDSAYEHAADEYTVMVSLNKQKQIDSLFFRTISTRDQEIKSKLILSGIQYFRFSDILINKESEEEFIDGKYNARYVFEKANSSSKNSHGLLQLSKNIFSENSGTGMTQKIIIDAYQATYTFNRTTGFLAALSINEKKHQKIQNRIMAFVQSRFTLKLVDGGKAKFTSDQNFFEKSFYGSKIFNQPDIFVRNKLISEKIIQKDNLDTLKEKLNQVALMSTEQLIRLSSQFRAWMFLHPEDINDIKRLLGLYKILDKEYNLLIDAIVNTSLPEVQDMFAQIIEQHKNSDETLRLLLLKASGSVLPTDKLLRTLLALKINLTDKEISSLSGLSLSNLLHEIEKNHSPIYDSITNVLQSYYKSNKQNKEDIIQYLLEAGNSGNDIYVNDIAKLIDNNDDEIQRESIYAFRFMHSLQVDSILSAELSKAHDSARIVRIYNVIKTRFPSIVLRKAVLHYIRSNEDKNEKTCVLFLEYLNDYIDEVPSLKTEMLSLKLTPDLYKIIREMIEKYDEDFAVFKK